MTSALLRLANSANLKPDLIFQIELEKHIYVGGRVSVSGTNVGWEGKKEKGSKVSQLMIGARDTTKSAALMNAECCASCVA